MQTSIPTTTIASPSNDFALLEAITDSSYDYLLEINVNKKLVDSTQAVRLVVRTYNLNPLNSVTPSIFTGDKTSSVLEQDPASIIDLIQGQSLDLTTRLMEVRSDYISSNEFDLIDLIRTNNNGIGFELITNKPVVGEINDIKTSDNDINQTALEIDRTIPQVSVNLLKKYKLDPAQAIVRTYSTNTAFDTSNGILGAASSSPKFNNEANQIAAELLSNNSKKEETTPPRYKAYMVQTRNEIPVYVPISFPRSLISERSNFYVLCTFYDIGNNIVQEFCNLVDNGTNVTLFTTPKIPPSFQLSKQKDGLLALTFTQLDPNATGIKLYKIVYNQTYSFDFSPQNLVGQYQVPYGQSQTFLVQNNDLGLIVFRALSYNGLATSADFSSQVIESNPPNEDSINSNLFISLTYEYTTKGLNILVENIPNDISILKLYKTNITTDPKTENLITTFFVGGMGNNSAFSYADTELDSAKNYRYRLMAVDIYGNEYDSTGLIEINYRPQTSSYASVTVTNPIKTITTTRDGSKTAWDVSFNISYAIIPSLEQNVRQFLTNQNLIQYYGSDILSSQLQELLVTKIELRDLDTNDKYFIAFTDGLFLQSTTNFGLIEKPSRYVYELTTFVRKPTTVLQGNTQIGQSQPRPTTNNASPSLPINPQYKYVPFNVSHPQGLQTGTLPKNNGNEFSRNTGYNQFEFGEIVDISYLKIDLLPSTPSVNSFNAYQFNKETVQLVWSISGDQTQISHFIIRRQNLATNKIDLIGKAHGINTQNNYNFVDALRETDKGVYKYIITIQYVNMTLSADYTSNEVVI